MTMPPHDRHWTIHLDGWPHDLRLGDDSLWTGRPTHVILDGQKVKISWRKTTSWREWNVARWQCEFSVGTHAARLVRETRQPPSAWTRARVILGGTPKAVVANVLVGDGGSAAVYADKLEKVRRTEYRLEVDGRFVPHW